MRIVTREMRRQLERDNAKRPEKLTAVPLEQWPGGETWGYRTAVYLSRKYLVQVFNEGNGVQRISANRTTARPDGRWDDGLTWDELQDIKRQIGMGAQYAIEVYPGEDNVVNVANMRHLWVLKEPLSIGWNKPPNV